MARSKSDISNSALRIFLQDVGKFYDTERGYEPFIPKKSQKLPPNAPQWLPNRPERRAPKDPSGTSRNRTKNKERDRHTKTKPVLAREREALLKEGSLPRIVSTAV